jgi:polysaccharide deacetylase 2 family uncharacterized protein YibQ
VLTHRGYIKLIRTKGKKNRTLIFVILAILLIAVITLIRPYVRRRAEVQTRRTEPPPVQKKVPEKKEPEEVPRSSRLKPPEKSIAIIIDDVGYPSENVEDYLLFRGKLTFAVLPFLEESENYAKILHDKGFEIMIHIPMEPLDYPQEHPGAGALFTGDSRKMVKEKLDQMITGAPYARGANNHMGSRATQSRELMTWTMLYLKKRDLYFIDSFTTEGSNAFELARKLELPSARRDIFLDNYKDFASINAQFEKLIEVAKDNGTAIGIGHIHSDNLLRVLNYQLPLLHKNGIKLVFASEAILN